MKNKILSKAYGGVTEARRKLYGLGLPRQWKVITSTLLLLFTFAIGNVLAEDVTWEGDNTVFVDKKLSDEVTTITVTKDASNSSKKISCINSTSNKQYLSINGGGKYLKFAAPSGYTITNIQIVWMSGAANQALPILFGESISAVGTVESKDKAVTITKGGFKMTSAIAASAGTNCEDPDDIALPKGTRQVMIGRSGAYSTANYTIGEVEETVKFRLAGTSGSYFTTAVGAESTPFIGRVVLTVVPEGYSITYHCNGATSGCPSDVASGATALPSTLATPAKTGYDFVKWYTDEGLTAPATAGAALSANANLYAGWTAHTHSLTWNIPGDATITNPSAYTHGTVAYGTAIVAPTLSRTGYDFLGWDATPAATMPDNDLTYTATWQPAAAKHDIEYVGYGSADISSYPTQYSEGIGIASFAPLADTEDQHFLGWSPASIPADATTDQTITATWEDKKVVTFNTGLGSAIAAVKVVSGEVVAAPTAPTRLNWTFQKWQKEGVDYDFATPVTEDITLDAVWSRDEISGASSDVVIINGTTINTGGTLSVVRRFADGSANSHVKFAGGIVNTSTNSLRYITFTIPTGYVATVKEALMHSTSVFKILSSADVTIDGGDSHATAADWDNAYFSLSGNGATQAAATVATAMPAGTYYCGSYSSGLEISKLTLKVSEAPIMVTFKTGEATYAAISATSGEKLGNLFLNGELPSGLVVPGYTFNGWTGVTKETVITASMTVQADLTPVAYNVTLDKGVYGSTDGAATAGLGDAALTISSAATAPAGYTLLGYFTAADGETKVAEADGSFVDETIAGYIASGKWNNAGDATLYAHWQDNSAVAKIGTTNYATFAGAIEAVAAGQTIQLLADCSYDAAWNLTLAGTVTLDLNGHDLTYNGVGRGVQVHNGAKLVLEDGTATTAPTIDLTADPLSRSAITYTSGTFDSKDGMCATAGGEIEINSGTYLATEGVVLVVGNAATVTVNDGVLISRDNGVLMGNGTNSDSYRNYVINVHGGILLGEIFSPGYASMVIYHPNVGELNIDGGTLVSTNGPAVVCRGGESNITGGTIVAQGSGSGKCGDASLVLPAVGVAYDFKSAYPGVSSFDAKISGDANVSGAAGAVKGIYAGTTPTTAEEDAVAISGGTFNSPVAQALCAENYAPKDNGDGTYGVKPLATSIDFEALATTNGSGTTNVAKELGDHNYTFSGSISTDNGASWDVATAAKPADKGLKIKGADGVTLSFDVAAGKLVTLKVGSLKGSAQISKNGGEFVTLTGADPLSTGASVYTYYFDAAQASYVIKANGTDYHVLQSIKIEDPYVVTYNATDGECATASAMYIGEALTLPTPTHATYSFKGWYDAATGGNLIGAAGAEYTPTASITLYAQWEAVSTDARLASITLDPSTGVLSPAFDPEVTAYTYTMPYGTADVPTITGATAVNAGGSYSIVSQASAWDETAVIRGVAASSDTKAYNITMKLAPKDGICLIWGNVTDNTMTRDADKSKYDGTLVNDNVRANAATYEGKTGPKFQKPGYLSLALEGQSFKAGDVVEAFITQVNGADKLRIFNANEALDGNVIAEGTIALGASRVVLPVDAGTIYLRRGNDDAGESYKDWNPCVAYVAVYRISNPILNKVTVAGVETAPDNTNHVTIEVPASTTQGQLEAIAYEWVSNSDAWTAAHDPAAANAWEFGVENTVTFTDKDGDASEYYITVNKAAASSDATLSALTVNGQAIALADGVFDYSFELPYGTTAVPTVVATAHHAGAVATVDPCTLSGATITVVPESGAGDQQVYTLTFTISAWKEVAIFDGSYMTALATSPTDEKELRWEVYGFDGVAKFEYQKSYGEAYCSNNDKTYSVENASNKYEYYQIKSGGTTKNSRYFKISVPKDYVAQFYVVYGSHSQGTEAKMYVDTEYGNQSPTDQYLLLSTSNRYQLTGGMSEIVGAGDYYLNATSSVDFAEVRVYMRPGYARTDMLGNGVLGTVCVPNNVAVEDIQGVTVYELMGREPQYGKIAFDEIVSGELEAGVPYVFQANGDKMVMFYGETKVDDPVDKGNGMYGTFVDQTLTNLDDVYYFAQRALWSCVDLTSLNLPANRAYVKLSEIGEVPSANPAPGRRRISMAVNGEQIATGIENTGFESEAPRKVLINGELFIIRGEKMYDAKGQLVK